MSRAFYEYLSDDERVAVDACTAGAWVPIELGVRAAEVAAPLLYPRSSAPLMELGRALARDNLSGVYSFVVRLMTVPFLVKQTATLWRTYHQEGVGTSELDGPRRIHLTIREYPTMPLGFLEWNRGFLIEAMAMTGAADVHASLDASDPHAWRYTAAWR